MDRNEVRLCDHCGKDVEIRNPSGYCDHLYYPERCEVCNKKHGRKCRHCGGLDP